MQREIDELRRTNVSSTQILDALRSDRQVPAILNLLKGGGDLVLIADVANSSQATQSSVSPPFGTSEGILQETCDSAVSKSVEAMKQALTPVPKQISYCWTIAPYNQLLIMHLHSLYGTWIHPAYPLFNMKFFIQDYVTGAEGHSSAFLVTAVCAAACDLLSPPWVNALGKGSNITALKQSLVAEANKQEAVADHDAQTTLEALQVMKIIDFRSEAARAIPTGDYERCEMDLNKQLLPGIKE